MTHHGHFMQSRLLIEDNHIVINQVSLNNVTWLELLGALLVVLQVKTLQGCRERIHL